MSTPPINPNKRRRLDFALTQPFRSPLKTPLPRKTASQPTPTVPPATNSSAPVRSPPAPRRQQSQNATPRFRPPKPQYQDPPETARPSSGPNPLLTITLPPSVDTTPHIFDLQDQHSLLLRAIARARADLETHTQALKIEHSPRDAELQQLIVKWRGASQAAAEEVFAKARDKVHRMGGLKGLREREREMVRRAREREREESEFICKWGKEDFSPRKVREDGSAGEGDEEEEEDEEGVGDREIRIERERESGVGCESAYDQKFRLEMEREAEEKATCVDEDVEGGYRMDMMLNTLNIPLGVIGFDSDVQQWVD